MRAPTAVRRALIVCLLFALLSLLPSAQALGWPRSAQGPAFHVQGPGDRQHLQSPLLDGAFTIQSQLDGQSPPAPDAAGERPPYTPSSPLRVSASSLQQTLVAIEDATILEGHPGTNTGANDDMWAGYDETMDPDGRTVRSLIQFDLSRLPAHAAVQSATLRVYYIGYWDYRDRVRTVTAYRITGDWTESGVTWNNAPGPGTAYGSVDIPANNNWGWRELDVLGLVQGWVSGSIADQGVMLRGPEASGSDSSFRAFSTREGPRPPELVVEYRTGQATPTATATRPGVSTPTPTATRPSASFSAYLPMVLKSFWRQGPTPTPTLTPVAVPTLEPCPQGFVEYRGTTDQNRPVGLCVKPDRSAVMRASLNFSISCNRPNYGANTLWERSPDDGFPIQDRAFRVEAYLTFDLAGTFTPDFSAVSGTWQGIEGVCSGFPGPCWEVCRGPVGQWSATRQ